MSDQGEVLNIEDMRVSVSYSFEEWLNRTGGTVVVSNMAGGLVFISCDGGKITMLVRHFVRPTGLAVHGRHLIFATEHEVHYFANCPTLAANYPKAEKGRYDAMYLPRRTYFTGKVNTHDIGLGDQALYIANTGFSCVCTLSDESSFDPRWKPPFVSLLSPEDRCHLNGLAIRDGYPKYVTCLGETDVLRGWKPLINSGGCLLDTDSNELILRGLAMPHSPRWHNGRLYFLNSAAGELCVVDLNKGSYDVVCCLPGMARGLSFCGDTAIVGLSLLRAKAYEAMPRRPVLDRFDKIVCGVALVDLKSGKAFGLLEFTAVIGELFDTAFIPGVRRPMFLSRIQEDEMRLAAHVGEHGWWLPEDDKKFAVNPGANPNAKA